MDGRGQLGGGAGPRAGDNINFLAAQYGKAQQTTFRTTTNFALIGVSGSNYTISGSDLISTGGVISTGSGNAGKRDPTGP